MYTYTKNRQLFILDPISGKLYRIYMNKLIVEPRIIIENQFPFQNDVMEHIKENNAIEVD